MLDGEILLWGQVTRKDAQHLCCDPRSRLQDIQDILGQSIKLIAEKVWLQTRMLKCPHDSALLAPLQLRFRLSLISAVTLPQLLLGLPYGDCRYHTGTS